MDTEASGKPTDGQKDITLDELAELESRTGNNTGGFAQDTAQEPKATVQAAPEVKPTEAKEPDWKQIAQTEQGRLKKLQSELAEAQKKATFNIELTKRQERMEKMLSALGEVVTSQQVADQPFLQEQTAEPKPNRFKEMLREFEEESAAEQINLLISNSGLDINDARLAFVKKAGTTKEKLERLQAIAPFLSKESPTQATEAETSEPTMDDLKAQARKEVLKEFGKVDTGGTGSSGRSSFTDYARDFAQGKISRDEYRQAKLKYGID